VVVNHVVIGTGCCRKSCMKACVTTRHLGSPANRNRLRQKSVDASDPGEWLAADISIEVNNLANCMYAGIGAACAYREQCGLTKFCQCLLQTILHGMPMWLRLPALPRRTVILQAECNSSQVASDVMARSGAGSAGFYASCCSKTWARCASSGSRALATSTNNSRAPA